MNVSGATKASYLAECNVRLKREMIDNLLSRKSLLDNILYKYKLAFLSTVFCVGLVLPTSKLKASEVAKVYPSKNIRAPLFAYRISHCRVSPNVLFFSRSLSFLI